MNRFRLAFDRLPGSNPLKLVLAALLFLTLGIATGWTLSGPGVEAAVRSATPAASAEQAQVTRAIPGAQASYADVVAQVAPAVVTVRSERVVRDEGRASFPDDPFFQQFF